MLLTRNHTGFLPDALRKGSILKWLKRVHAWLGIWGAALGLLFGTSGILLNHRAELKIPAVTSVEASTQVALPEAAGQSPQDFARWFGIYAGADRAGKIKVMPAKKVIWNDHLLQKPAEWTVTISKPGFALSAIWSVGNRYVEVKRMEQNFWGLLNQLHMGKGVGVGWILLADTLAGGLIVLALSGFLLWSKLHGPRLAALALIGGAVLWGGLAAFS